MKKESLSIRSVLQISGEKRHLSVLLAMLFAFLAASLIAHGYISGPHSTAFSPSKLVCELVPEDRGLLEQGRIWSQASEKVLYMYWGGLVADVNPALNPDEVYEIGGAIVRYSAAYGLSPRLVVAIITVESSGVLKAESHKGARGLMQVMPWWIDELNVDGDLFDIDSNIRIGCYILSENIRRWGHKEGILRYYRGGSTGVGDGYFTKVNKVLERLSG
jgi:hypothetical protein